MSHYKSNLRDIEFNLFEVLGRDDILGTELYADLDWRDRLGGIAVDQPARMKRRPARPIRICLSSIRRLTSGDCAEPLKTSYRASMDSEAWQLELPAELGVT